MNLVCCWCEHKMVSLYGKQHGNNFSKKKKIDEPYIPAFPFPSIHPKELKAGTQIFVHPYS